VNQASTSLEAKFVNLSVDVLNSAMFKTTQADLQNAGVKIKTSNVLKLTDGNSESYTFSTDQSLLKLIALYRESQLQTVSLVETGAKTTVTDFTTKAVTVVAKDASGQSRLAQFGYANFGNSVESLSSIASALPIERTSAIRPQAGSTQCTGGVPANLLQVRAQAQNDASAYQGQLGTAVAAVAGASAAVLIACGATVVTVGASTPPCIAAGTAYATAFTNAQEKTRQRDDANIRVQYSQSAIDQWKSSYASSSNCTW
jgi:hypothetical protein